VRAISLFRDREIGDATIGHIETQEGTTLCVTLEELWHDDNKDGLGDKNRSRIPAGSYVAFRRKSPAHGGQELFELRNVPGRGNIQIHAGNTTKDTLGCILVGTRQTPGQPAIEASRAALSMFMHYLKDEPDILLIVHDIP
jgi:hypothetical protein